MLILKAQTKFRLEWIPQKNNATDLQPVAQQPYFRGLLLELAEFYSAIKSACPVIVIKLSQNNFLIKNAPHEIFLNDNLILIPVIKIK